MQNSRSESYAAAGVDITAGYRAVELMKAHIARTYDARGRIRYRRLRRAFCAGPWGIPPSGAGERYGRRWNQAEACLSDGQARHRRHRLRRHVRQRYHLQRRAVRSFSSIISHAGKMCPKRSPPSFPAWRRAACRRAARLIGGETAEMPGFYPVDEYDLAGFSVGAVNKEDIIDQRDDACGRRHLWRFRPPACIPTAFPLCAAYSTWRKRTSGCHVAELGGASIGETLLTPTKIYVKPVACSA